MFPRFVLIVAVTPDVGSFTVDEPELHQRLAGRDARLGIVSREPLGEQLRTAAAVSDLHGAVAVHILALHLRDAVSQHLDDRDRHGFARFRKNSRHAALAADQSDSHLAFLCSTQPARTRVRTRTDLLLAVSGRENPSKNNASRIWGGDVFEWF